MASDPYSVGTITVANGGTTVIGTDTFWVGKVRKNDMLFVPAQGLQARITADADDNEELTITSWAGTSLVDEPYEIIPASDTTTSAARLRDLLAQMSVIEANGRGLFYRFSDSVSDADPSAGYLRLNNVAIASATAAYVDNLDANGATVSAILDTWDATGSVDNRGQLWLRSIADPSAFHAFQVTSSIDDGTGYRKVTLEYIGGSGAFAADDELMVMFNSVGTIGGVTPFWVTRLGSDADAEAALAGLEGMPLDMPTARIKGRVTAGTGIAEDLTADQVQTFLGMSSFFKTLLDDTTGAALFASMGATLGTSANGAAKLPNGWMVQWGSSANGASSEYSVTFPQAFPTACHQAVASVNGDYGGILYAAHTDQLTPTTFALRKKQVLSSGGASVTIDGFRINWIAVGN